MPDAITQTWTRSDADRQAVADGCTFDLAAAERVRTFFAQFLRHSKGQFAGQPFHLTGWQWSDLVAPLFGWCRPDGTRRYRRASVWISKKNGKSTLAAGLILYGLVADGELGAEVYGAAADREQANIIYGEVKSMVEQSPALGRVLEVKDTLHIIRHPRSRSFYKVLSKESKKTGHGVNSSMTVIDEVHVVDRPTYQTLRYAGAARRQPLLIEISTAGDDKTSLGHDRYQYAKRLAKGEIEDPQTLALIYEADPEADWTDESQWRKANPSLGITISIDSFRADFNEARQSSPADQATFKQLRLGLWQEAVHAWLPVEEWDACANPLPIEELAGKPCWGALDLASKLDLCAWVLIFDLGEGRYHLVTRFWCPEEADSRRQKANRAQLRQWIASGHITATQGNVTDYDTIEAHIISDCEAYNVEDVAADPWNSTMIISHLQGEGIKVVEFRQSIRNFSDPTKELEKLTLSRMISHDGNPAMRWMIAHLCVKKDPSGNVRPDKEHSADHIDGPVAAIMALSRPMQNTQTGSIYDTQGVEIL